VAIVLTHGHFDHAGNANTLARLWDVPVYAHALEMPYLTGRSEYPPIDPTVGGAIAAMSRMFPGRPPRVERIRQLPADLMEELPGWGWIHTPGHTPGHVSLFRASDAVLLAGDALVTMNMDSWIEQIRRTPEPSRPPAPLTIDWVAAAASVRQLAALDAKAIGAGHGLPIAGDGIASAVRRFADTFTSPAHGRYVQSPARTGPDGLEWVPPPVPDPFPRQAMGAALVTLGAVGLAASRRRSYARTRT
jgi:glyoxylase-like metal-dependent hydrolase (beta-lactamase superfamily II)